MTLQVKYFNSGLPGAPSLTGQVGSLINVLDAVLKDGFNSKTITSITRSGSTATVTTSTSHGYTIGSPTPIVLDIAGADQADYNGTFPVTITGTTTFTYTVANTPTTPATTSSSMTCKVSPLGWTKPFTGTNVASYRMPAGSSQLYLGVDDNQSSGAQYYARIRGFETMSAAGVASGSGTGLFPTDAQISGGVYWNKSTTQDGTARQWRIGGDANFFWLHVLATNNAASGLLFWFGDPISYKAADTYPASILGLSSATTTTISTPAVNFISSPSGATSGLFFARSFTLTGGSVTSGWIGDSVSTGPGNGGFTFPNGPDNGLHISRIRLGEAATSANRAILPGLFQPLHNKPGSDGDIVTNILGLTGVTGLLMAGCNSNTETYRYLADITGPWR